MSPCLARPVCLPCAARVPTLWQCLRLCRTEWRYPGCQCSKVQSLHKASMSLNHCVTMTYVAFKSKQSLLSDYSSSPVMTYHRCALLAMGTDCVSHPVTCHPLCRCKSLTTMAHSGLMDHHPPRSEHGGGGTVLVGFCLVLTSVIMVWLTQEHDQHAQSIPRAGALPGGAALRWRPGVVLSGDCISGSSLIMTLKLPLPSKTHGL
jgi:hypothetical protein